jgi:hypothetical protein
MPRKNVRDRLAIHETFADIELRKSLQLGLGRIGTMADMMARINRDPLITTPSIRALWVRRMGILLNETFGPRDIFVETTSEDLTPPAVEQLPLFGDDEDDERLF